jgi:hypothetical protein
MARKYNKNSIFQNLRKGRLEKFKIGKRKYFGRDYKSEKTVWKRYDYFRESCLGSIFDEA